MQLAAPRAARDHNGCHPGFRPDAAQALADVRHAAAARASASAASGLVSVPTSGQRGLPNDLVLSNLDASRRDLLRAVGGFTLDRDGRRLSQLRCAVGFAARAQAVSEKGHRSDRAWMVTTTYRGDKSAWRARHWSEAVRGIRRWCAERGFPCRYVWVAELQTRGVIHYHAVFWLPQGVRMPKWDVRGWWPHGMSNRKPVRSSAVGYLMKYLSKGSTVDGKAFPKGARIHGAGGLDHALRRAKRWLRLPAFVQGNSSIHDDWKRREGGGWLSPTGQQLASEFKCTQIGGVRALIRLRRHSTVIDANGPFSWLSDKAIALQLAH